MSSSWWCSRAAGRCAALVVLAASAVAGAAAPKVKIAYAPFFNFLLVNKESVLQAGPEFRFSRTDHTLMLRVNGKFPFASDDVGENLVQLDQYSRDWRVGGSVDYQYDWTQATGSAGYLRVGALGEWGVSRFGYTPIGAAERHADEHSFAVEGRVLSWLTRGAAGAWQYAPQLWIRYAREWKSAGKTGIVVPAEDPTMPATVDERVIGPPVVKPGLGLRLSMPTYLGGDRVPLAVGPSLAYALLGQAGDFDPGARSGRVRAELWLYYFPFVRKLTNIRVGVAPFLDARTHGSDALEPYVYGVLVQLRVGEAMLEY
jgi:hypothetical protein